MNNFDRIRQMSEEEFAEWLEDFAEAYVSFWIMPGSMCDFSHRDKDKKNTTSDVKIRLCR